MELRSSGTPILVTNAPSAAARLDRLPICGFHFRFIALVALGGWFDLYDLFMMAYVGAALQAASFVTLQQYSHVLAAGFLGMFVGTIGFGVFSDYFGRRASFVIMLLVYSGFTLLGAFSPNPSMLIVTRALGGIGVGAELVVIDTYVTEIVPRSYRGRAVALTLLAGFTAVPAAALLCRLLVPTHWLLDGWRWVMIIGGLGAIFAWYMRRSLPESPRWAEAHGRTMEAEQMMAAIEDEVRLRCGGELPPPGPVVVESSTRLPIRELFGPEYRSRTGLLVIFHLLQTIGVYGFANWAPTFLLKGGHSLSDSLEYGFWMALLSPIGPLLGVLTAERFERKWSIVVLAAGMGVCGLLFPVARSPAAIVGAGALMTILSYWFSAVFHAYQAELFPTRARATGVGFTYGCSRLSAMLSSVVIGAMLAWSVPAVFIFMSAAMAAVAALVAMFGPRTNSVALEDVSG